MIFITSLVQPTAGAVIARYCKICRRTEITVNPHAVKPKDGDLWVMHLPCPWHVLNEKRFELPPPAQSIFVNGAPL